MQNGFIKVAGVTPDVKVADCRYNADNIIAAMDEMSRKRVALLVTPQLGITAHTCGDLFFQQALIAAAMEELLRIRDASAGSDMITVAGLPVSAGNGLYNAAAVVQNGRILGIVPKQTPPGYGEHDEARHFRPAPAVNTTIRIDGQDVPFGPRLIFRHETLPQFAFGIELGEEPWPETPGAEGLAAAGATILVKPAASSETVGKDAYRRSLLCAQSMRLVCGCVYAGAGMGESTTDLVYGGHDLITENGAVLAEARPFSSGCAVSEIDVAKLADERRRLGAFPACGDGYTVVPFRAALTQTVLTRTVERNPFVPDSEELRRQRCEDIFTIQAHGLKKRLAHTRSKKVVLGISGGLDSCLALLVCVRTMDLMARPRTDVVAVAMPGFGSTKQTRTNAQILCDLLGVSVRNVDITKAVLGHFEDIGHDPAELNVVYENSQARERTQVLMDIANQEEGFVIGTGDLSELALGFATFNGDHMSMYGVNASIPKTLVRYMVRDYADSCGMDALRATLIDILDTPVSPELLPPDEGEIAQKTESIIGPYELHDFFLYYVVRWGFAPAKVFELACYAFDGTYARGEILQWLNVFYRRFFAQQFKRSCLPDGPKVGSVSLSPRGDWRMPSDASGALWLRQLETLR